MAGTSSIFGWPKLADSHGTIVVRNAFMENTCQMRAASSALSPRWRMTTVRSAPGQTPPPVRRLNSVDFPALVWPRRKRAEKQRLANSSDVRALNAPMSQIDQCPGA